MAVTSIADVWVPDIWINGVNERMNTYPSLFSSGAISRNNILDQLANGPGNTVNMPFFNDITDHADAIQVEGGAITKQKITTGQAVAVALNREVGHSANALSAQLSGSNPLQQIINQMAMMRLKQRQRTVLAMLRGLWGTALAANSINKFFETTASYNGTQLIDADMVIDGNALLGENAMNSDEVVLWMHPVIRSALRKQDENSFERTSTAGGLTIERYKGVEIFQSNALVRAGTTNGFVYDTWLIKKGVIFHGEKPQVGDRIDVASMQYDPDKTVNEESVYDRTRFGLHIDGTAWTGTPAGQSPTNAELQTAGNWALRYSSADRVNIVRIQTNG